MFVEKTKTHILCSVTVQWGEKKCRARQVTNGDTAHVHFMLDN